MDEIMEELIITQKYLQDNPDHIFVFGDNLLRKGKAGAAKLRDLPNSYGFITKKYPNNDIKSFYKPEEYKTVFEKELDKLIFQIVMHQDKTFLISKLGSGLANRFHIWEKVIKFGLVHLKHYENVKFLWTE
jgi:hypothetical protein